MKSLFATTGAIALLTGLSACTQEQDAEANSAPDDVEIVLEELTDDVEENASEITENLANMATEMVNEDAPEADGTERFYGKKAFTIVSEQTGVEAGEVIEHVREWGRLRAEIKNTTMSVAGFSQETNQRAIYESAKIITINEATKSVVEAQNPMYDSIVSRMKGKSGVDFGKEMMAQMGGVETDEKGRFANHDCGYWEIASLNSKTCITEWGGTLHSIVNMGGMSFEKTATAVRMNDGGPDSAFAYDASKATQAPNLQDIMKQMQQPG